MAHGLLKDKSKRVKVTLIAPSTYFYYKVASPRAIINPNSLPVDKVLVPIADGFKQYSPDRYEFVQAYVNSIDHPTKTVQTSTGATIHYDSLVIASGTSFTSPLWSTTQGADVLSEAIRDIHARLPTATSVLVAGGGPAGVETTAELAETYGHKKEIIFLSGSHQLLPRLKNAGIGREAESRLTKMGVKVRHGIKVTSSTRTGDKEIVRLSDGEEKTVDVFIDATGDKPNSKFVPEAWLNAKGYVKTDPHTLRLDVPGVTGVYCFGSVGSYSDGSIFDTMMAQSAIAHSLKLDLSGQREAPHFPFLPDQPIHPLLQTAGLTICPQNLVPAPRRSTRSLPATINSYHWDRQEG